MELYNNTPKTKIETITKSTDLHLALRRVPDKGLRAMFGDLPV